MIGNTARRSADVDYIQDPLYWVKEQRISAPHKKAFIFSRFHVFFRNTILISPTEMHFS